MKTKFNPFVSPFVARSQFNRRAVPMLAATVLVITFAPFGASAGTWTSSKTGNWDDVSANGWNGAYPNAIGAVATYDNTNATANAQVTQNVVAGVTVGSFSMTGVTAAATSGRSWTIVPTNAITLNQDGAGGSPATITFSATSNNANDRLVFNAGTLTLADDLVVSKTTTTSIVANALQISAAIGGTGNVTLENVSQGAGNGNIFLSPPTAGNTFTGNVLVRKGAVTFNHKDAFGNAANAVTLGESGQGNATLVATAALGTVPNPIIAAAGAGTLTLGSNSASTTANTTFSGTVTLNGPLTLTSSSPGSQPVTFSNVISGSGGLAKAGAGTVALNGANNYTGSTNITGGTLAVGSTGTLGDNVIGNDITISGGNLLFSNPSNLGSNQVINYSSGGIGVNFTPVTTIPITDNSASGGVFGINYTGTGGVTSLASLYNGRWSLGSFTAGTFDGSSLGAGKDSVTEDINTYRLGGGGGTLTILNNILTGTNILKIAGSGGGRVNLPAANSFTGATTIENGTVGISSIGNAGSGNSSLGNPALADSAIVLGSGANAVGIDYTGSGAASTNRVLNLAGTTGTVTLSNSGTGAIAYASAPAFTGSGARTIQLGNTGDSYGGSIPGFADDGANKTSVSKAGLSNSTWVLSNNTYTGTTRIDGGVLEVSASGLAGSYLNLDGDSQTQYAVVQIQSNTPVTFARTLSATASFANVKWGTNSGFAAKGAKLTVNLNSGAGLVWNSGSFMGAGTDRLVFGSTTADNQVEFQNPFTFGSGVTSGFNRVIFVEKSLTSTDDSALLSGVISTPTTESANGGFVKQGKGVLILSGANTYSGATFVSAGTLVAAGNAPGTAGDGTPGNPSAGVFGDAHTTNVTPTPVAGTLLVTMGNGDTGSVANNPTLLIGGAYTVARPITITDSGTNNVYSIGGSTDNTATFSGAITFTNGTANNNTLKVTQVATTGTNALHITGGMTGGASANTKTINFDNAGAVQVETTAIVNGAGGGKTAVLKSNSGTLTFSGSNTYTGDTTMSGGTLLVNGSIATGAVSVGATATLGGGGDGLTTGLIGGAITVNTGGKLAPGASMGTLTATSSVTFAGSSSFEVELNAATADRLNVTGALDITGATLNVTQLAPAAAEVYIIAQYGSLSGTQFVAVNGLSGYNVVLNYDNLNQIALVKTGSVLTPFEQWATGAPYNLSGDNAKPDADPDHDGIKNLMEFVLGGNPTTNDNPSVLPTVSASGNNLVIVFNRSDASELVPAVTVKVQTSNDLSFSTPADDIVIGPVSDVGPIAPTGASYTVTGEAGTTDTVTVTIPKGAATKKFARLVTLQP